MSKLGHALAVAWQLKLSALLTWCAVYWVIHDDLNFAFGMAAFAVCVPIWQRWDP